MKYLVTGGAGFIGSHLVENLAKNGNDVIILDNFATGSMNNISQLLTNDQVALVKGSVTDYNLLLDICKDVDGIFHEGAIPSVPRSLKDPLASNEANITGTLNILVAARDIGIKKVVYASSSSVYGDTPVLPKKESMVPSPKSPYAVTKLTGEYYCQVFSEIYGIEAVALRYFNVFGPRQDPKSEYSAVIPKFIVRLLHNESPIIYGDGDQTRDFTYVKDVVQANVKAMESHARGVFNVAYGSRISLNHLVMMMKEIMGVSPKNIYKPARQGDVHDSLADISSAKMAFNYLPAYTLESGLTETIQWYQETI